MFWSLIKLFGNVLAKKFAAIEEKLRLKSSVKDSVRCDAKARFLAETLVTMTKSLVSENRLKLAPHSPSSIHLFPEKKIAGRPPMYNTGKLLDQLMIRKGGDCTYEVYWSDKPVHGTLSARDIVAMNSGPDVFRVRNSAAKRRFFAVRIQKALRRAGRKKVTWEDIKNPVGIPGFSSYKKRPFWDNSVRKFVNTYGGKPGVYITVREYSVIIKVASRAW